MRITSIEFKNFASYGNQVQSLNFEDDKSELFLTLGKNGDGKTTIANAIIFALYGKVEGVRLSDLPNRINGELWVRVKLQCGTMQVEIERGLAPSKFEVLINGVEFDKAGKKSVQDYLEEEVYGIPYHVFKNIIILSINDFKSFLTMTPSDKKQIIDRMFGFSILNDMQRSIKDERKSVKMDIEVYDSELNQIMDSIGSVKLKLNTLIEESSEKQIGSNKKDYDNNRSSAVSLKHEIEYLKKKVSLYEGGHCPTCETKLDTDWHTQQLGGFQSQISDKTNQIKALKETIDDITAHMQSLKESKGDIEAKVSDIKYQMKNMKAEFTKLSTSTDEEEFQHLKNLIKEFEEKEKEKSSLRDGLDGDYNFMEIVEQVLGEDGVKNLAVKTILPGLNTNIAAMAQTMHLPFQIRFDEKFNCIINHLGEEINPMTLSTGERKKADFIIVIAIIKILKLRFPQINLLFLDELLSSVDHDGVYNILKILKQVITEHKINTFVINHTVLPHEIFDKKLQIYRENGFSKFAIETIE
jgi:exonuclease SbcC